MEPQADEARPKPKSELATTLADDLSREQKRDLLVRRRLDVAKFGLTIVGSLVVYFYLQQPDSIVNRSVSAEGIARERAKLLLEVVREKDPVIRSLSVNIIASAYPKNDPWPQAVRETLRLDEDLEYLQQQSGELANLLSKIGSEQSGERPGRGPTYRELQQAADQTAREVQQVTAALTKRGVELPRRRHVIGCITLDVRATSATSAQLVGASAGGRTREWFDFGPTEGLGFSVESESGVGTANKLKPNATYYYRYVTQDSEGTCLGDMKHFTTPAL